MSLDERRVTSPAFSSPENTISVRKAKNASLIPVFKPPSGENLPEPVDTKAKGVDVTATFEPGAVAIDLSKIDRPHPQTFTLSRGSMVLIESAAGPHMLVKLHTTGRRLSVIREAIEGVLTQTTDEEGPWYTPYSQAELARGRGRYEVFDKTLSHMLAIYVGIDHAIIPGQRTEEQQTFTVHSTEQVAIRPVNLGPLGSPRGYLKEISRSRMRG